MLLAVLRPDRRTIKTEWNRFCGFSRQSWDPRIARISVASEQSTRTPCRYVFTVQVRGSSSLGHATSPSRCRQRWALTVSAALVALSSAPLWQTRRLRCTFLCRSSQPDFRFWFRIVRHWTWNVYGWSVGSIPNKPEIEDGSKWYRINTSRTMQSCRLAFAFAFACRR